MVEKNTRFFTNWRIGLISVFALSVLLYLPSIKGLPIWDDNELIHGGAFGTNSLIAAFTRPFQSYFRPLTSASFVFDSSYAKGNPFFYHQTNILLHALTALLICCLVFAVTKKQVAGLIAGVFFAAQPMQVGAAAWIGGRPDVLAALFVTLFMIGLVQYHQTQKKAWLATATIAYLLAALSKEQAAFILPAVPISVFALGSRKWKDVWHLCIPFAIAVVVYAALWILGGPAPMRAPNGPIDTIVMSLKTTAHYGLAFFTPNDRSMITFTLENYPGYTWLAIGAIFVGACAYFLRETWKTHRAIAWIAICGLLVYLPVSNFPTVPSFAVGPFRVAIAGTAVACLFGIAAAYWIQSKRYLLLGLIAANLVAGVGVAWYGIHQWLTPEGFFTVVAKNDPHFVMGVQYYAHILDSQRRFAESVQATDTTIRWALGSDDWVNLLETQKEKAITPEIEHRLRSNGGRPNIEPLGNFIGSNAFSMASLNRMTEAARIAHGALYVAPHDYWLNFLYGELIRRKDRAQAIHYWEAALKLNPDYSACAAALAHERVVDKRFSEAVALLSRALDEVGYKGNSWLDMADAKIGMHDLDGAKSALDQAGKVLFAASPVEVEKRRKAIRALERPPAADKH
ncbi:MAG: hypothetical protein P4L46_23040 [Fimbriimonas sp.]|nr:hypothetical protein [Fimbriimonas sp.]